MAQTPNGSTHWLYTALSTPAKAVSAISNAVEAVVSCTAHGFSNTDIVFINSGWGRLNRRAYRIKSVTTDTFVLEGCNTTNTTFYPPGSGGGTAAEATTPIQVTQVLAATTSGGEAKKVRYKYQENDVDLEINDGFNPVSRTMEIDADAIGGPGYSLLQTLTDTGAETVVKTMTKSGSFTLTPCTVALNEEVIFQDGQVNRVRVDISGTNRSVRYAS